MIRFPLLARAHYYLLQAKVGLSTRQTTHWAGERAQGPLAAASLYSTSSPLAMSLVATRPRPAPGICCTLKGPQVAVSPCLW